MFFFNLFFFFFFFNDTATTEIYTLSLHDALPIAAPTPAVSCAKRATNQLKFCASRLTPAAGVVILCLLSGYRGVGRGWSVRSGGRPWPGRPRIRRRSRARPPG